MNVFVCKAECNLFKVWNCTVGKTFEDTMRISQLRGHRIGPVLHFYRMKLAGNLVRIIITNSRTISLQPFPDYANRPARQEPVIKPVR